ncbi:hypothetical protein NP233_g5545 [Leucocoprinus birnbaumii]|uniref:Uncharacterized protein n=1 Tax=Leucocoprinus birnbaumii TaxID=56174 RepID=A0AAD5VSN0_9AGAR|nr:hypothetical protein NP233_g5545 [Leucocoprinus birnbaumii]
MTESLATFCFAVDEIATGVVGLCDASSLCAMMRVNSYAQGIVRAVLSRRIRMLVDDFLLEGFEEFWDTMGETKSLICGSVALAALDPGAFKAGFRPKDLNLIAPMLPAHEMMRCIEGALGYTRTTATVRPGYRSSVFRFYVYRKGDRRITVSQCTSGTALFALVDAPATHEMNAISATHLYCPYPTLLDAHKSTHSIEMPGVDDLERYAKFSFDFISRAPYGADGECLVGCFGRWRRARGLQAVGKLAWGGFELECEDWMTQAEKKDKVTKNHRQFCTNHVRWRLKRQILERPVRPIMSKFRVVDEIQGRGSVHRHYLWWKTSATSGREASDSKALTIAGSAKEAIWYITDYVTKKGHCNEGANGTGKRVANDNTEAKSVADETLEL